MPAYNTVRLTAALVAFAPLLALTSSFSQSANLDTLPPLRLVEEMRIGHSSDPDLGFSRIGDVAVDRDGQIFVFESRDLQLRVYSATGQRLRTIGRGGAGPGEFDAAYAIGVKGDTLWAIGGRGGSGCSKRIHLYSRNGVLLSTAQSTGVRIPLQYDVGVIMARIMRSDGNFVGQMSCQTLGPGAERAGLRPNETIRVPRVLFDAKGVPIDTLGWYLLPPYELSRMVTIESTGHLVPGPTDSRPLTIQLSDGLVVVDRAEPRSSAQALIRIMRVTMSGDTIATQSFSYTPRRYSTAQLDSIAERSASNRFGAPLIVNGVSQPNPYKDPAQAKILIRSSMTFPAFQTPIQSYFATADGAVWLQRENDSSGANHWVLFDAQGRPRGRLDVPANVRLAWSSGNTLWAVRPDVDDVPWLVKFRIAPN